MDIVYLKKVREGDTEAFSYFVEKYSAKSYSLAFSLVKNEEIARDIVQTSFLKAYKGLHKFREDAKFSTWLFRIVVNECNQNFRKKKISGIEKNIEINELRQESDENKTYFTEKKKILKDAIRRLKPKEAMVIRLYYLCELNHEEIKEITGLSLSNSKVILHRARKNLKEILENQFAEELESLR
jgi:RNA polymerase sigma-70 factor (ECF subfamily)